MTMFPRVGEKRRIDDIGIEDEEAIGSLCRLGGRPVSPKTAMEQEKRIRREIANSNERRRMQSINAGFASLKNLLPHHEGEKLSKAAILQQTAEYIYQLEQEKTRLLAQNCQLKRLLNQQQHHADNEGSPTGGESPSDDGGSSGGEAGGVGSGTQVETTNPAEELRREMIDLRVQLDRERRHRMSQEEQVRVLEAQTYAERVKEVSIVAKSESKAESVTVSASVPGQVTSVVEVTTSPHLAIIKEEPPSPSVSPQGPAASTAPTQAAATSDSPPPALAPSTPATAQPQHRQPTASVLSRQSLTSNVHNNQLPANLVSGSPATTIVTVVPSAKGGVDAVPQVSVFEALTASGRFGAKVEVEPEPRVPSPDATIEYVDDSKNHTVYIVNSTSAACQKSLDTICEAIRHLEGDHMFQTDEQHPRIEEEIITEETLTIEDHTGVQVPVTIGGQVTLAGEEEPITLHMVGEPQEVPLELTTHRPSPSPSATPTRLPAPVTTTFPSRMPQPPTSHNSPLCSISTSTSTTTSPGSSLLQATRPGVIVVKHP